MPLKVLFTHLKPDIWQYKVASTLKKKGVKTTSISLLAFNRQLFKDAFDEVICLDLPNLKPKTLITHFIKNPLKFIDFFKKIRKNRLFRRLDRQQKFIALGGVTNHAFVYGMHIIIGMA